MKTVSLFSGIGGLDLGLEDAGHEIVMQVESDPYCCQILQHHFPGRELRRDIAEVTELPADTELLAAGFPCPDVSTCNNVRPGLRNGNKTGLCAHIFRVLRKTRVPWVLLENVPGLLMWHMNDVPPQPPAVSHVVAELEHLGYRWAQRVIGLTGFGLPQRRRRVFILASTHGDPRDVLLAPQAMCLGQCIELFKRDATQCVNQCGVSNRMCAECALAGAYDRDPVNVAEATEVGYDRALGGELRRESPEDKTRRMCDHPPRECYDCFWTPPFVEPRRTLACADLAEKRHGPLLHELFTLTTCNGKRMAIAEDLGNGKGAACMLHVEDAERIMGLPAGWTEPCYPLNRPGSAVRQIDTDADASVSKRMSLLGIAVAPPQARWIGERLVNPYDLKFSRAGDGVRFKLPVPGGPNATIGGCRTNVYDPRRVSKMDASAVGSVKSAPVSDIVTEAQAAASGWPEACWNMLHTPTVFSVDSADPDRFDQSNGDTWRGRRALPDCSDAPVLRGFIPLGEFIRKFDRPVNAEHAAGYLERLSVEHVATEPFFTRALGGKVSSAVVEEERRQRKEATAKVKGRDKGGPSAGTDPADDTLADRAGKVCWVPTKIKGADVMWPACALHPDDDRDVIPTEAMNMRNDEHLAATHVFCVYFGDATYEWREAEDCVDFDCELAEHLRGQPILAARPMFKKAVDEADAWFGSQLNAKDTPHTRAARAARDREEESLRRAVGAPAEATACGRCKVCRSNALAATELPFSTRHKPRAAAKASTLKPLRGVRRDEPCPRLEVIAEARKGHVGANLALLGQRAVGKRVRIHWANERDCFKGTVSGFDPETWLHSLEYDDGDVEPAIRLWREVCHLGVPEDTRADEENATREAKRRKVAETEIAEAKKQLEAAEAERDRLELSREMADDDEADDDEADDKADDEASPAASPAADAGGSSVPTTPAQTMTTRSVKELCQLRMSMSSAGILGVGPGAGTGGRGGRGRRGKGRGGGRGRKK